MEDCVFCKIVRGEAGAEFVYKDEDLIAFKDIKPKAPVHILIVPKKHIESVREVQDEDREILGKIILTAKKIAEDLGVAESGYRLVINNGRGAGQLVPHLHLHLLASKKGE